MTALLDQFIAAFGADMVSMATEAYLGEPRGHYISAPRPLLRPRTVDEVSAIVRFCNELSVGVVPYGGGTGLVGGQVYDGDRPCIILSLERMNALRGIYPDESVMVVEAGVILADAQGYADAHDRLFPLSLAAEGSCRIGGNLATNAGGVQVLRYGNARDLCLGVEAVLPDGSIHHGLRRLRKDNTGYDLRNLLIGSEGSLGVITAASLKLFPKPREVSTALLALENPAVAIDILGRLNTQLDGVISAFELIGRAGFEFVAEQMPHIRQPFAQVPEWAVLVQAASGTGSNVEARMMQALTTEIERGSVQDAVIAQSIAQADALWELRETIPEANRAIGAIASHDVSIPISRIPEFIETMPAVLARIGDVRINCFGHLGDGNLHYNIFPPWGAHKSDFADQRAAFSAAIHDKVAALGGSISAEHGVGRLKARALLRYGDGAKLAAMRAIKAALDPQNIMNPDAVVAKED